MACRLPAAKGLVALAVAGLLLTSCGNDDDDPESDVNALPSTPPAGERLCDFLPRESAAAALGNDELEADGTIERPDGELAMARCRVTVDGQDRSALDVSLDWAVGMTRSSFDGGLADDRYHQLAEDAGLGYSWSEESAERPDGSSGAVGRAQLAYGDHVIDVWIGRPADGRDAEADAVAIAQQVTQTLELSDEWTLQEDGPPSR